MIHTLFVLNGVSLFDALIELIHLKAILCVLVHTSISPVHRVCGSDSFIDHQVLLAFKSLAINFYNILLCIFPL